MAERPNSIDHPREPIGQKDPLDDFLKDMIQGVYRACESGTTHLSDDTVAVNRALDTASELLETVMEGKVDEWIG